MASVVVWSLQAWNLCWHSNAPFRGPLEFAWPYAMDTTLDFSGSHSVSPVLGMS